MINLLFIFVNIAIASIYDAWRMTKSVLIYWGYGDSQDANYNPYRSNEGASASDEGEMSMFAFWYFYVITGAFLLFDWKTALISILCIIILHWTGGEDLGYYIALLFFKNPQKYEDTHRFVTMCGIQIPAELYWLGLPRKIGFIVIPSIIGFVCGKDVPGKKFVVFALANIFLIVLLSFLL